MSTQTQVSLSAGLVSRWTAVLLQAVADAGAMSLAIPPTNVNATRR